MTAPLKNLLITKNVVPFQKVYFGHRKNPKSVNTLTADDKHYLVNRDNLAQLIQMQLSQKQKTFPDFFFFFAFLKYILSLKHLPKQGDPHS